MPCGLGGQKGKCDLLLGLHLATHTPEVSPFCPEVLARTLGRCLLIEGMLFSPLDGRALLCCAHQGCRQEILARAWRGVKHHVWGVEFPVWGN